MPQTAVARLSYFTAFAIALAAAPPATSQAPAKAAPKLEPIAETRLLMEGLVHSNFRGLENLLKEPPTDAKAWVFGRGQALLIAETGNLLLMRPPKTSGQPAWFDRAVELRTVAQQLAKTIASKDFNRSRAGLIDLSSSCNRCHQAFRVPVAITAFAEKID